MNDHKKKRAEAQRRALIDMLRVNETALQGMNEDMLLVGVCNRINYVVHGMLASELLCDLLSPSMEKAPHHVADFSSLEERVAKGMIGEPYGYWEHPTDEETREEQKIELELKENLWRVSPLHNYSFKEWCQLVNANLVHMVLK